MQYSTISQNVMDGFGKNLLDRFGVRDGWINSILVTIRRWIQILEFFKWFFSIEKWGQKRYTVGPWHSPGIRSWKCRECWICKCQDIFPMGKMGIGSRWFMIHKGKSKIAWKTANTTVTNREKNLWKNHEYAKYRATNVEAGHILRSANSGTVNVRLQQLVKHHE